MLTYLITIPAFFSIIVTLFFKYSTTNLGFFLMSYAGLFLILFGAKIIKVKKKELLILLVLFMIGYLVSLGFLLPVLMYPVFMNFFLAFTFALSLKQEKSIIEKIALKMKPDIPIEGLRYCRKVTRVWVMLLAFLTLGSIFTVIYGDPYIWALFNGIISYVLIGALLLGEFLVRIRVINNLKQAST